MMLPLAWQHWLHMGGYGYYVWSAYCFVLFSLVGLFTIARWRIDAWLRQQLLVSSS